MGLEILTLTFMCSFILLIVFPAVTSKIVSFYHAKKLLI